MIYFEKVSRFQDVDLPLPTRATAESAGYDFVVAEDVVVPSYINLMDEMLEYMKLNSSELPRPQSINGRKHVLDLQGLSTWIKLSKIKPTLVSTGMKCYLEEGTYLQLVARSSLPLKHWLLVANGVGVIDRDYVDNSDNEGEIFFQLINLSPFDVVLKKGDKIGQGIIQQYFKVDNDEAKGERTGGFGSTGGMTK